MCQLVSRRPEEVVDLLLIRHLDPGDAEGKIIAVMTDIDRQHDVAMLGDLVGHDGGVEDFLHRFAIHLNPAGLAHDHGVLLPAPDALRAQQIACDQRRHHRQAQAGRADIRLEHEGEPRPAGRGEGPTAGQCHALQSAHHRVFALDIHEIGLAGGRRRSSARGVPPGRIAE